MIAPLSILAQINVTGGTDGSLTITPKGIRGKEPTSTSVDASNIAIGVGALKNNVNAAANIAIGRNALSDLSYQNPSPNYAIFNLAIGENALRQLQPTAATNAYNNVALGFSAMGNRWNRKRELRPKKNQSQNLRNTNCVDVLWHLHCKRRSVVQTTEK